MTPTPCPLCEGDRMDIGPHGEKRTWYCYDCGVVQYVDPEREPA